MNLSQLQKINDWLIDGARSAPTPKQLMAECCERLVQAGIPLWRVAVFIRTLHPDVLWPQFHLAAGRRGRNRLSRFQHSYAPEFKASPVLVVFTEGREVRGSGPAINLAARLEKIARPGAPSWHPKDLPASAGKGGATSASFRSPASQRPRGFMVWRTRCRRPSP